ncbi:MAG TPA: PQQ-dependent sugar dehydrogenase, partial [Fibrobacteria bacterium]|nr:PQQ-dependent sugar dehydrogenase [Fibrobacteria bacterium]
MPVLMRAFLLYAALFTPAWAQDVSREIPRTVTLRDFFGGGFTLERPVAIAEMPGHDSVFAVTQQSGAVVLAHRDADSWLKHTFDSVGVSSVNSGAAGEDGGLLGFAFHPDYVNNRIYYLYYVAAVTVKPHPGRILLEERYADSTLRARDTTRAPRLILSLDKPYVYHNGGTLRFGPDGFLYTAIGDGGSSGDPQNRAQNPGVLWGKFLRIMPDGPDAYPDDPTRNYGVPADNPFVDSAGYLPEIWAYGLRSPWKWDWNPLTGTIWVGDVGQSQYEEVTTVPRGGNLGWKIRE